MLENDAGFVGAFDSLYFLLDNAPSITTTSIP
jgi:hypothetical protein